MKELIFIVEDAPDGGSRHEHSAPRFSPKRTIGMSSNPRFVIPCVATSKRVTDPRWSGFIMCARTYSPYEAPTRPCGRRSSLVPRQADENARNEKLLGDGHD